MSFYGRETWLKNRLDALFKPIIGKIYDTHAPGGYRRNDTHSVDAAVQAFFVALKSWRKRRKTDPHAKPPKKRKWYFKIEYKRSAMKLEHGVLRLSNGRENDPLVLAWEWELPQTVVVHWTGTQYEALATYQIGESLPEQEDPCLEERRAEQTAGIDLGEVHLAVSYDGERSHLMNGRELPRVAQRGVSNRRSS